MFLYLGHAYILFLKLNFQIFVLSDFLELSWVEFSRVVLSWVELSRVELSWVGVG